MIKRRGFAAHGPTALLLTVAMTALLAIGYGRAIDAPLVSDDINAVVNNEFVTNALQPGAIFSKYSWWGSDRTDSPGYRPLTTLTFALQHEATGLLPRGFRFGNLLLHGLASLLVALLALELRVERRGAAFAGLAFAVLPIHSEAVIWIVGRAEILTTMAFTAVTIALLRGRRSGGPSALPLACACLFAGLLAKENAVTVLAVPALLMMGPRQAKRRGFARAALETAALLLAVLAYAVLRAWADGPFLPSATAANLLDNPVHLLDPVGRVLAPFSILGRYLSLVAWPHPLSIDYSYNALGIAPGFRGDPWSLAGAAGLAAGIGAAWRWRSVPAVPVGLGLSLASYTIVSNSVLPIGTILGERLFYLPSLGLCLAAGPLVTAGLRSRPAPTYAACVLLLAAWTAVDNQRSSDWRSPVALYSQTVRAVPESARAHMELAAALGRASRTREALEAFRRSLEIKPDYAVAAYNMGNMLVRDGDLDAARKAYRRAVEANPALDRAWSNMALTFQAVGDLEAWLATLREAAEANPRHAGLGIGHAMALAGMGRFEAAQQRFDALVAAHPELPEAFYGRALLRERLGGCRAAASDYRRAADLGDDPEIEAAAQRCSSPR